MTRNNARTKQNDLEYKLEKLLLEKNNLNDQLLEFQEAINELQVISILRKISAYLMKLFDIGPEPVPVRRKKAALGSTFGNPEKS